MSWEGPLSSHLIPPRPNLPLPQADPSPVQPGLECLLSSKPRARGVFPGKGRSPWPELSPVLQGNKLKYASARSGWLMALGGHWVWDTLRPGTAAGWTTATGEGFWRSRESHGRVLWGHGTPSLAGDRSVTLASHGFIHSCPSPWPYPSED